MARTATKENKAKNSQAEEAKKMLEKMEQKKNADECPFC